MKPADVARRLYRATLARRAARETRRFRPRVRFEAAAPGLLLSPHWDDAVLDCWSILSGEQEVNVVNVFAGSPVLDGVRIWDAITGATDSAERTRERLVEDGLALACAGRRAINLPLLDAQYPQAPSARSLDRLDVALVAAVQSASRVYAPAGIGSHPDHLLTRHYARMLLAAGIPVTLYAELPYCVLHGWPPWVDGREPQANRDVDVFWRSFLAEVEEMPELRSARVGRLDDAAAAAKLQAMRCYRTQLAALSYGGRDLLEDPEIHRFEVRWDLGGPRPLGAGAER